MPKLRIVAVIITAAAGTAFGALAEAGIFDKLEDAGKVVIDQVTKPAVQIFDSGGNIVQHGIDAARGKQDIGQSAQGIMRSVADAGGAVIASTRTTNTTFDNSLGDLSSQIGGDFGRVIYEASTDTGRIQREFAFTASDAVMNTLAGRDPVYSLAFPLAAAIRDARAKYDGQAQPLPSEVKQILAPIIPPDVLARARWVVDDFRLALPAAINSGQKLFSGTDHAVVVDDIIVFSRRPGSSEIGDLEWWAHEIYHVYQYSSFGVDEFAYRYAKDWASLENEAEQSGKYARGYLRQLDAGRFDQLQPQMDVPVARQRIPVAVDTPLGRGIVFREGPPIQTNFTSTPTDKCLVNGEQVVIGQNNIIYSVPRGGISTGQKTYPMDPRSCMFDLVAQTGFRYCVQHGSGTVFAGPQAPVGFCQPCPNGFCQ